jgi:hypothetical protein
MTVAAALAPVPAQLASFAAETSLKSHASLPQPGRGVAAATSASCDHQPAVTLTQLLEAIDRKDAAEVEAILRVGCPPPVPRGSMHVFAGTLLGFSCPILRLLKGVSSHVSAGLRSTLPGRPPASCQLPFADRTCRQVSQLPRSYITFDPAI